jgi:hypothetical protein
MNVKMPGSSAVAAGSIAIAICLLSLGGCFGDYKLISLGPSTYIYGWHQYETPRSPDNPVEEAVVRVAQSHTNAEKDGSDIFFIVNDYTKEKSIQVVDVVGKSSDTSQFPEKNVTRYRIVDDKISAMSEPAIEFYVDADFERAILRAVAKTWSPDRVVIYSYGDKSVAIMGDAVNNCTTNVKVYDMNLKGNVPLAQKRVAYCFKY